jgi:hypothetical protein
MQCSNEHAGWVHAAIVVKTTLRFTEICLMLMLMLICYERKNIVRSLKSTAEVVPQNRFET